MESQFFSLISDLVKAGVITDTGILLFIVMIIFGIVYYFIRPILDRVNNIPNKEEFTEIANTANSNLSNLTEDITKHVEKLIEILDEVEDVEKDSYKEIKEIKKDVEQIKQILNQFQGHLMYGRNNFGNRELS